MLVYPDYYDDFQCIAGECKHSCCIGWEISIDSETLELYKEIPGKMGGLLKENITEDGCFKLGEKERCPFLNDDNLCNIIISLGEEALCNICSAHPRFINVIGDRTEVGLGLCCEEAARIIVNKRDKVKLMANDEPGLCTEEEKELIRLRDECIHRLQQREFDLYTRFKNILTDEQGYDPSYVKKLLKPLERLECEWDEYLERIEERSEIAQEWQIPFEQLAVYFVYRHFFDGETYRGKKAVRFALFCVNAIAMMFRGESVEELEDIARRFSAEIEYSEENTEAVFDAICKEI